MDLIKHIVDAVQNLLKNFDGVNINFNFGSGAIGVAAYLFMALGLYTIARNRGLRNPWLAWIPVANLWLLGCISDQYRYVTLGEYRNRRKKLLTLSIVEVALIPVAVVLILVWVFGLAALGITGGNLSEEARGVSVIVLILLFMVMLLPFIALAVIAVILQIQKCCAYWDLFGSCVPQKRKLFSALSIVASCIGIDLVAAILIFACRNKEEGMPPRMEV